MGRGEDTVSCALTTILEFFQSLLEDGQTPSTLRVHMAAISSHRWGHRWGPTVDILFPQGANRLRPPVTPRIPAWDLFLVLDALTSP